MNLPRLLPLLKQHLPGTRGNPECPHRQGRDAGRTAASRHLALQPSAQAHSPCQPSCCLLPDVDGTAVIHLWRERSPSYRCLAREGDRLQGGPGCSDLSWVSKLLLGLLHCVCQAEGTELLEPQFPHLSAGKKEHHGFFRGGFKD